MKNKCIRCGKDTRAKKGTHGKYCNAHAIQFLRHGRISECDRAKNGFLKKKNVTEIYTNNSKLEKNGVFIIDTKDLDNVLKHKWSFDSSGYPMTRLIRLHTFLLGKPKKGMCIDHINGNKKDNRRVNLRIVTFQQNFWNTNSSGVCWHRGANKWRAYLRSNNKQIHLGLFENKNEARKAYEELFIKIRGVEFLRRR